MLTYTVAKNEFKRAKDPAKGKSLDSRTYLRKNADHTYSVWYKPDRYQQEIKVCTIRPDGKYRIESTSGRFAVTDRIRRYTSVSGWGCQGETAQGWKVRAFIGMVVDSQGKVSDSCIKKHNRQAHVIKPHDVVVLERAKADISLKTKALAWLKKEHNVTEVTDRAAVWLYHNRQVIKRYKDGSLVMLCKSVRPDFSTGRTRGNFYYKPGTRLEAYDYNSRNVCGGGLHFCSTFTLADGHNSSYNKKHMNCWVDIKSLVPIGGFESARNAKKAKARFCIVDSEAI